MGNLHLVTGYAGRAHVTAADMGSLFEALVRGGQFVMAAGANFEATVVTNNSIRVKDGELLMQGRHVKLDPGAYVDLAIENGEQGLLRHDLIVARYTKNAENGVEECSLVVIKGTAVEGSPVDPEYTTGDINAAGDILHDFPLYRVPISGLNVGGLVPLFTPQAALAEALLSKAGGKMTGPIDMAGSKIAGLAAPTANDDAVPLGYADGRFASIPYAKKIGAARNMADNSYFKKAAEIINQRGLTKYTNTNYTIDRWNRNANIASVEIVNGGVAVTAAAGNYGYFAQNVDSRLVFGKKVTFAVKTTTGLFIISGDCPGTATSESVQAAGGIFTDFRLYVRVAADTTALQVRVDAGKTITLEWAALYEGEYTAETLPEYQPKGYAAELAECQRYFINNVGPGATGFYLASGKQFRALIPTPATMRAVPTVTLVASDSIVSNVSGTSHAVDVTAAAVSNVFDNGVTVTLTTASTPGSYVPGALYSGFNLALSADL